MKKNGSWARGNVGLYSKEQKFDNKGSDVRTKAVVVSNKLEL